MVAFGAALTPTACKKDEHVSRNPSLGDRHNPGSGKKADGKTEHKQLTAGKEGRIFDIEANHFELVVEKDRTTPTFPEGPPIRLSSPNMITLQCHSRSYQPDVASVVLGGVAVIAHKNPDAGKHSGLPCLRVVGKSSATA